jgi:hypothetical protein
LVSNPTSTFGSVARGKPRKTESSKLGLSFAAQPAALTIAVSFTVWLKPHLAALSGTGFSLSRALIIARSRGLCAGSRIALSIAETRGNHCPTTGQERHSNDQL